MTNEAKRAYNVIRAVLEQALRKLSDTDYLKVLEEVQCDVESRITTIEVELRGDNDA